MDLLRPRIRKGGHGLETAAAKMQKPQTEHGVPEAENRPGRRDQETGEDQEIHRAPPLHAEHLRHGGCERQIGRDVHDEDEESPASEVCGGLDAGRRRRGPQGQIERGIQAGGLGHGILWIATLDEAEEP